MQLYTLATVIRSKNAGPFTLTIDLMFDHESTFRLVLTAPELTPGAVAALYGVPPDRVRIHAFEKIRTIKVSMPRLVGSGSPGDRDVYGSQQHFPLADLVLSDRRLDGTQFCLPPKRINGCSREPDRSGITTDERVCTCK